MDPLAKLDSDYSCAVGGTCQNFLSSLLFVSDILGKLYGTVCMYDVGWQMKALLIYCDQVAADRCCACKTSRLRMLAISSIMSWSNNYLDEHIKKCVAPVHSKERSLLTKTNKTLFDEFRISYLPPAVRTIGKLFRL